MKSAPQPPLRLWTCSNGGGGTAENSLLKVLCPHTMFLCTFFFRGEQTYHFKVVLLSWGQGGRAGSRVLCPLHISGFTGFLSQACCPGPPLAWLPIPIHLSNPPALQGERTWLRKSKPSPRFCSPGVMICICRIETGKQYINVCANFRSLPRLLPLFTFYLYRMCAV